MERNKYWFWLSSIPGVGNRTAMKLLSHFRDVEQIYNASEEALEKSGILKPSQLRSIIYSRNRENLDSAYDNMRHYNIDCIDMESDLYPEELRVLYDPPLVLFVKGCLPRRDEWMIAVVGARSCSSYGRQLCHMLSRGIACSGVSVISGMARGIDSAAHWGALEADGRTYAVLGCGVDICYPAENLDLYTEIAKQGGIISEFPPGTPPEPCNFPRRNRIIAALSKGILVVEARRKSGSLITVEHGLDIGKEIFAVPGRVNDALSEGCNRLIRAGARLVMEPSDILEEFGILAREFKKNNITLDNSEKVVYASMCLVPRSADELSIMTGMRVQEVIQALITMELKGIIHRVGKNQYVLSV
ncbi:MAG: DNA-processing protein DprA [Coprococcus sp.]